MSDIAVQIMLHGLIALVPIQGDNGINHMAALLVDARQPRDIQCSAPHRPRLTIVTSNAECVAAGCTAGGQGCTCDLDFQEITLAPDVQPAAQVLRPSLISAVPVDSTQATDFGYIANLRSPPLGQNLKPDFLAPVPPRTLVARMRFPFESVKACSLSTRPGAEDDMVVPMSFRPLGALAGTEEKSQAVAQMFIARYRLPIESSENPKLTLTLSDFEGANVRAMVLKAGPEGYSIKLVNERETMRPDDPCDDGVGRDFALFYDLAQNPLSLEVRMIPHAKYAPGKSSAELLDPECQVMKDP